MSDSDSAQLKMVRVEIKGVVQGVCYRDWAVEHATILGLNGWVRNRKDGPLKLYSVGIAIRWMRCSSFVAVALTPPWSPASTLFLALRILAPALNADQLSDHLLNRSQSKILLLLVATFSI